MNVAKSSRKKIGKQLFLFLLMLFALMLCSCNNNMLRSSRPIEDIHNLDGRRVGVAMGNGPDYLLTSRKDMTLVRYNTVADMVLALSYGRVDAIAVEVPYAPMIISSVSGLRVIDEPIATDGLTAIMSVEREDLLGQFNEFIKEFTKTPEYTDLYARAFDTNGFTPKEVKLTGTGELLKAGTVSDAYPFSYIDFTTDQMAGFDVEILKHFANYYGYRLEFVGGNWEAMEMGIKYNTLDIAASGVSDLYRPDFVLAGSALVSDVYMPMDIVFIEVADKDSLKVNSAVDF